MTFDIFKGLSKGPCVFYDAPGAEWELRSDSESRLCELCGGSTLLQAHTWSCTLPAICQTVKLPCAVVDQIHFCPHVQLVNAEVLQGYYPFLSHPQSR